MMSLKRKYMLVAATIIAAYGVWGTPQYAVSERTDSSMVDIPLFIGKQECWQAMWWNVENLFHPDTDSLNNDREFTPAGIRRWTHSRYRTKVAQIAQVVVNAGGWQRMDVIGLCEVEDSACVADICRALGKDYRGIHYDSRDTRGIDVVLIYRTSCILLSSRAIRMSLPDGKTTRDLLHAQMVMPEQDTVDFLLCHLPSMRGGYGYAATQRKEVIATMQHTIDSLLLADSTRHIIVMGDMNDAPHNDLHGMHNMMCEVPTNRSASVQGSYRYRGVWTYLDQCYLSKSLYHRQPTISVFAPDYLLEDDERYLGVRPKRTYIGIRYLGGNSDHLPIVLRIK